MTSTTYLVGNSTRTTTALPQHQHPWQQQYHQNGDEEMMPSSWQNNGHMETPPPNSTNHLAHVSKEATVQQQKNISSVDATRSLMGHQISRSRQKPMLPDGLLNEGLPYGRKSRGNTGKNNRSRGNAIAAAENISSPPQLPLRKRNFSRAAAVADDVIFGHHKRSPSPGTNNRTSTDTGLSPSFKRRSSLGQLASMYQDQQQHLQQQRRKKKRQKKSQHQKRKGASVAVEPSHHHASNGLDSFSGRRAHPLDRPIDNSVPSHYRNSNSRRDSEVLPPVTSSNNMRHQGNHLSDNNGYSRSNASQLPLSSFETHSGQRRSSVSSILAAGRQEAAFANVQQNQLAAEFVHAPPHYYQGSLSGIGSKSTHRRRHSVMPHSRRESASPSFDQSQQHHPRRSSVPSVPFSSQRRRSQHLEEKEEMMEFQKRMLSMEREMKSIRNKKYKQEQQMRLQTSQRSSTAKGNPKRNLASLNDIITEERQVDSNSHASRLSIDQTISLGDSRSAANFVSSIRKSSQLYENGEYARAIREWKRLLSSQEENAGILFNIGCAYHQLNRLRKSEKYWKKSAMIGHEGAQHLLKEKHHLDVSDLPKKPSESAVVEEYTPTGWDRPEDADIPQRRVRGKRRRKQKGASSAFAYSPNGIESGDLGMSQGIHGEPAPGQEDTLVIKFEDLSALDNLNFDAV